MEKPQEEEGFVRENCERQKLALYDKRSHRKYYMFVMNEQKLTPDQRARLWHWRLGHPSHSAPYYMNKRRNIKDLGKFTCLNEDCVICDKAKFTQSSFKPDTEDMSGKAKVGPMHRVYIDGFGGQKSFGCRNVTDRERMRY